MTHGLRQARHARLVRVAVAVAALAGCTPAPRPSAGPPVGVEPARVPGATASGPRYAVQPTRSEVRVLTFRAGPLARLGHSHVLISRDVTGTVSWADDVAATSFELTLPVATFAVDEPAARAEEGAEFATVPTPQDVAGTRRNLLGPQVLDADAFPALRVLGSGASTAAPGEFVVHARIELRGRVTPLDVPTHVVRTGDELVATGEFRVAQSALGLTPFSVALGALQVRDELVVRFRLVATRAG